MADFQETYQLNAYDFDLDGEGRQIERAAALLSQLPSSSRLALIQEPDGAWDERARLLWQIEYDLRCIGWSLGRGKGKKPKPLKTPGEAKRQDEHLKASLASKAKVDEILASVIPDLAKSS